MLKKRIIPVLLISNNLLVKTKKFSSDRVIGNIIQTIKVFTRRGSDELSIIDLDASRGIGDIEIHYMKEIISECNLPISVGGGIKSINQIGKLLNIGFDKVIINKGFLNKPELISDSVNTFGSQSITLGLDVIFKNNSFNIHCSNKKTTLTLKEWVEFAEKKNIGEIFLSSVDHDGIMDGYNINLINYITQFTKKPLILNSGCGKISDIKTALSFDQIKGAAASSIFFYTEITPEDIKKQIENSIPVRKLKLF